MLHGNPDLSLHFRCVFQDFHSHNLIFQLPLPRCALKLEHLHSVALTFSFHINIKLFEFYNSLN